MTATDETGGCIQSLTARGMLPACDQLPGAPAQKCDQLRDDPGVHQGCAQSSDPYFPFPSIACVHTNAQGEFDDYRYFARDRIKSCVALGDGWDVIECYCCCFADGATIAPGDTVLAATPQDGPQALSWQPTPVATVEATHPERTLVLSLADGDRAVHHGRVLMLGDGRLVRAGTLVAGDELLGADGAARAVEAVTTREARGLHRHLATAAPRIGDDGSPLVAGHLLGVDGLVTGDLALEVLFDALGAERVAAR